MADTPLLVVFPRGQLTPEDKTAMREAGIIAVEADDPKQVHQLHLAAPLVNTGISGDMIVRAALAAIAEQPPSSGGSVNDNITGVGRAAHKFIKMLAAGLDKERNAGVLGTFNDPQEN